MPYTAVQQRFFIEEEETKGAAARTAVIDAPDRNDEIAGVQIGANAHSTLMGMVVWLLRRVQIIEVPWPLQCKVGQ